MGDHRGDHRLPGGGNGRVGAGDRGGRTDYEKLKELMARKEETERLLEEKMDRWMYLNDLAERIAAQQS